MTGIQRQLRTCLALLAAGWLSNVQAAPLIWNGGDAGIWSTGGTGWLSGSSPASWSDFDAAVFTGTPPLSVSITIPVKAASISVSGSSYILNGPAQLERSGAEWHVADPVTNTVTAPLTGTNGLTKSGGGILLLTGTNKTFTGPVAVTGGALRITTASAGSLGPAATTAIILDGGELQTLFTANTTVNYAMTPGPLGGSLRNLGNDSQRFTLASQTLRGSGSVTLAFGTQNTRFVMGTTAQTNFTGRWIIDSGGNVSRFVDVDGTSTFGRVTGDDAITLRNSGSVLFRGTRTYGTTHGITVGEGGGNIAVGGSQTVVLAAKLSGQPTDPLRLDLGNSASVLVLANTNNTWLGTTTLAGAGLLRLGSPGVMPDTGGTLHTGTGTTFDVNGFVASIGGLGGTGTVDNRTPATAAILAVGGNHEDASFSGALRNTGVGSTLRLVKTGNGMQTLSGDNTTGGGLDVQSGILRLLSPLSLGSGPVTLSGGTLLLQGSGTFSIERLAVEGTATLDLGTRGARLEIETLTLAPGSRLLVAHGHARIRFTGTPPTAAQLRAIRLASQPDYSATLMPDGTLVFPGQTSLPWWDAYPLIVENASVARALELHADTTFSTAYADPTWGIYAQKVTASRDTPAQMHAAGLNHLSYYETFGEATTFAIELATNTAPEGHTEVTRTFWNWHTVAPQGGALRWAGPQNYFDAEAFCGPFTRLHPVYGAGGRAMSYPDGSPATGYQNDDPTDPRKSRVLDAGGSKDVLGRLALNVQYRDEVAGDPARSAGLLTIDGRPAGHLSIGKDTACPMWIDQQRSSILYSVGAGGTDGIWADNFSAWDNFGYPPVKVAFGDWSVARFRSHLTNTFDAIELAAMGVTNPATFDVRADLRARLAALGGTPTNLDHAAWNHPAWLDDPVWRAFKIFKRQTATAALGDYDLATKEAATAMGRPDFAILGNDVPLFSLGFVRGQLDAVSTEITPGWYMGVNSRGFMLPPVGRFAPAYKLGPEHTRGRLMGVWMYLDGPFAPYRERPGMVNTLYYEMLANHALPMLHEGNERTTQDTAINAAFFAFVGSVRDTFAARTPVADVAVYYSSSSLLANMTPAGFLDMDNQPHGGGFLGWSTALGNLHVPYRALPEWKLSPEALATHRILILPDTEVLDAAEVALIADWVASGGRLIVTGNTGDRAGENGNFARHPTLSIAGLTGVPTLGAAPASQVTTVGLGRVIYRRDNLGLAYFNASTAAARSAAIGDFQQALAAARDGDPALIEPVSPLPETVGLNLYADAGVRRWFIDVNNLNVDPATDTVTPTPPITITVAAPDWLVPATNADLHAEVLAPNAPPAVTVQKEGADRMRIQIGQVMHYASIVITSTTHYPAAATPVLTPGGGTFHAGPVAVAVDHPEITATLRYTLDGSEPTTASPEVAHGAILPVANPGSVRVRAWLDQPERASAVAVAEFDLTRFGQWAGGGIVPSEDSLRAYALGAAGPGEQPEAFSIDHDNTWFSLIALVRTNDPSLHVTGLAARQPVPADAWSTNGLAVSRDVDATGVPDGHERRIYSIPVAPTNTGFIGVRIELAD